MKGVLMKVGQLVSFIAEGLPDEAQQALAVLQADAAPMAPTLAAEVVEAELGAPPEQVFRRWDDLPVAAASIGQVHRAETKDRREVAVKVQFPGVGEAIEEDLDGAEVMYQVFSALALNGLDARGLVDELRARMREELDYRLEAGNLAEFARHFAGHPWVRIPALVPELSQSAGAHDRVGRRHVVGRVRGDGLAGDEAARRRGHLALRPALDHAPRRVQRRPAPRQLPLPPRRQRDVPRLRARQALDAGRVGAARAEPRRDRRAPRPGACSWRRWSSPASSPTATASTREGLRLRVQPVPAVPRRRVHVHPRLDARDAGADLRHQRPARRGHRQAQHAAELRHPRPRRVGRRARSSASSTCPARGGRCCSSTAPTRRRRPSSAPPRPPGGSTLVSGRTHGLAPAEAGDLLAGGHVHRCCRPTTRTG